MPSGKKIIIDFTEMEETELSGKGELEKISISGVLTVKNPSSTNRVWNSSLFLEGLNSVSLKDNEIKIGEINAGDSKKFEYNVLEKEVVHKPLIELNQEIDTYYEKGEDINWNFVLGHRMPTSFTIKLTNNSGVDATANLIKKIPEYFGKPLIDSPPTGSAEYKEDLHEIHWTEVVVPKGDTIGLHFRVGATPDKTDLHEDGAIEVNYKIKDTIRSLLDGKVWGLSDNLYAIDNEEISEHTWGCTIEFQNLSDFRVKLTNVKVAQVKETTKVTVLDDNPNIELEPQASWTKEFEVESAGMPKFSKLNNFSVLYEVHKTLIGHILRKSGVIPVAAIECEKILEPKNVNAHAKTEIKVKVITKNIGTASLFKIKVEDVIPASFKPPSLDLVKTSIRGEQLRQGVILEIEPNDEEPAVEHKLTVSIPNLTDLTNPLNTNEEVIVEYPLTAWDPRPGDYLCPLESTFNVIPPGPPVKAGVPEIKIIAKTVRRKYRAYKSVTPGSEEGEYVIPIVFANKGEIPVQKVTIKDVIPISFTLVKSEPEDLEPAIKETENGTELTWKISDIAPGQQVQLKYIIKGTGEYESLDPEISFD